MYFKSLRVENYGLYHGDHSVDFASPSTKAPLTLIGGLNGRGKTTLLEGIFLVLFGRRALKYLSDDRISYSNYLKSHINKSAADQETSISLTFEIEDAQSSIIQIRRAWSDSSGVVEETFEAFRNGRADPYVTENWDYFIEEYLPLNVTRFFFFDGEKISQIADDESYKKVKESIRSLLGLTTIDQLMLDIRAYMKKATGSEAFSGSEVRERITSIQHELEQIDSDLKASVGTSARLNKDLGLARKNIVEMESQFWKHGGNTALNREEIEAERDALAVQLEVSRAESLALVSKPSTPLLLCSSWVLKADMDLQGNEEAGALRHMNVLMRLLREQVETILKDQTERDNAFNFLDLASSQLSSGKPEPSQGVEMNGQVVALLHDFTQRIKQERKEVFDLLERMQRLETRVTGIEMQLSFHADSVDVKAIWNRIKETSGAIARQESLLHAEEEQQRAMLSRQENLDRQRLLVLEESRKHTQDEDEISRTVRYLSMTISVMEEFKVRIQQEKVQELSHMIHESFVAMSSKQSIIRGIEIDPVTLDIKLIDYNGGDLHMHQLSAGEKQLFAVSILWGLAKASGYQLPVIIDTPLGRLDSNHRNSFLKSYLPYASRQVIVLSTDEEIKGKYYDLISPHINNVYLLEYDEESKSSSIREGYFEELPS
jgi:DNA sulfur modification protein DndD